MKALKLILMFAVVLGGLSITHAQGSRKEKQAAKRASVKKMVDDGNYVFEADIAYPLSGGSWQLTMEYDLKVARDTITAFLPYFGQAYMSPDPTHIDGGIKFTTTHFNYTKNRQKNGNWEVSIKPTDKNILDWRDVQQLRLDISEDGYANLQVTSTSRDPISFSGYIVQKD